MFYKVYNKTNICSCQWVINVMDKESLREKITETEPGQPAIHILKRGGGMKIEVVPRFCIDGKYYTADQLPEEKNREIVTEKIDLAMAGLKYERKRTA